MNFPPNLFKSPQFKIMLYNIDNTSHNNLNIDNQLEFHQNLAKKLSKYINTSKNFQLSVFSYIKSMTPFELIKICSINSKWFIDIVHQLILFSKLESQLLKFIEIKQTNNNIESSVEKILNINDKNNNIQRKEDLTTYKQYFEGTERKFISLSKKNLEKDFGQILIQAIRYLTINSNVDKNNKQYNNILTLSFDFLSEFEKLKETFLKISKEECFKFPIKVVLNNENGNNFNKSIYNFELPEWILKKESFTVPELFCAYFEQIILLHFQYNNLFHTKIIPFPFQNKLDEILDNANKIITFIDNISEKNKLFSELNFKSISQKIKDDKNIKEEIDKRSNSDKLFFKYLDNNIIYKQTTDKQINIAQFKLHQSFFKNNSIIFVENLYFTNDNIIGTIEDFVYKSICEQINNIYRQQIANDLINDKTEEEFKIKKKRKKKHRKKKKHNKEGENNEEKIKDSFSINNEDNNISKIEEIELNLEEKNKKEEELNENNDKELKKENSKLEEKKDEDMNKNENKNNNDNNCIKNNNNILNEEKNIDNNLNSNSNGGKNLSNTVESIIITNSKPKKEKKKKPFFLFPVTKTKKQKENNSDSEKNKNNQIKKDKKEEQEIKKDKKEEQELKKDINISNKILSPERKKNIESSNQKLKIETQNINSPSLSTKRSSSNNSPIFQNEQIDFSNNIFFYNIVNNNFLYSYNNYISKMKIYQKKPFYQNHLKNPFSFISSSINNFTNEILENTKTVNYNKELLSQFRLKYIEKITSLITSILNKNNNKFSISQYGSYISGLSIENSDVDIMIKLYDNSCINDIISILIKEFTNDEYKSFFSKIYPIYTASVPVIKLECEIYDSITDENIKNYFMNNYRYNINEIKKLKFDITFFEIDIKEKENKQPSEKVLDFIHENINLYPNIIDIIYIMKRYIQVEKLNLSFKGGISSYSLFLLILSYIKSNKNNLKISIGTTLIEFLLFYSELNFGDYIINPKNEEKNQIYEKLSESNENSLMFIKDPFTGFNVSKSSFRVKDIQFAFSKAAIYIINSLYINNNSQSEKHLESSYTKILSGLLSK